MRQRDTLGLASAFRSALVLAAALGGAAEVGAEPLPADPVVDLRNALRITVGSAVDNPEELAFRKRSMQKAIDSFVTIGQMRRGLLLQEWREDDTAAASASVDAPLRNELAKRFAQTLRERMETGNTDSRLAAVNLVGDMGVTGRTTIQRTGIASEIVSDLVNRTRDRDVRVRSAAALALGKIFTDPTVTAPALRTILSGSELSERQAASVGLLDFVRGGAQVIRDRNSDSKLDRKMDVNEEIVQLGIAVVPTAAVGLTDPDALVRRNCTDTLRHAVIVLTEMVSDPPQSLPPAGRPLTPAERQEVIDYSRKVQADQKTLMPLVSIIGAQASVLARGVADPDDAVRILSRLALEEIGSARYRLNRQIASIPSLPREKEAALPPSDVFGFPRRGQLVARLVQAPAVPSSEDVLLPAIRTALPALIAGLNDPNPRARLAAIDALEVMSDKAQPATPGLIRSLDDRNSFVQWAAARTLGRLAPAGADGAIPGLARLLPTPDLDVELAASTALEKYGPEARAAVPSLIQAVSTGDVELREAAMKALVAIGTDARPAVPSMAAALGHNDPRVRRAAAQALARFGPLAVGASDALSKVLNDSDAEVRRLAADALLAVNRKPLGEGR